jgi:hypothetical protein
VLVLNGPPGLLLARLMPDPLRHRDEVTGLLDDLVRHVAHHCEERDAIYPAFRLGTAEACFCGQPG